MHFWFVTSVFLVPSTFLASHPPRRAPEAKQQAQQQSLESQQQPPQPQQGAQQPSTSQTSPSPAIKRKKVWTNEDVISLRTPADAYVAEKEAQEAAAAEAAAKQAEEDKQIKEAGLREKLPTTLGETRELIAAKEARVTEDQEALDRYTAELPSEPEEHKDRMQAEIKRITSELPKERLALKVLQDHLETLTKAQLKDAPVAPTVPPPS